MKGVIFIIFIKIIIFIFSIYITDFLGFSSDIVRFRVAMTHTRLFTCLTRFCLSVRSTSSRKSLDSVELKVLYQCLR